MKEKLFIEDAKKYVQIEEFLKKELSEAKPGSIDIQDTPLGTRITIYTLNPGLVIGVGGEKISSIVKKLEEMGISNPQIDVQKIKNPFLDPEIVAQYIAEAIEKGINYKKVANYYLDKVMKAGAKGCEIIISGKIAGEKASTQKFYAGFVEKSGTRENVLKGFKTTTPKVGVIGIKVFISIDKSSHKKTDTEITGSDEKVEEIKEEDTSKISISEEGDKE